MQVDDTFFYKVEHYVFALAILVILLIVCP